MLKEKSQFYLFGSYCQKYCLDQEIHVDETGSHVNWRVNVIKYFWNVSLKNEHKKYSFLPSFLS